MWTWTKYSPYLSKKTYAVLTDGSITGHRCILRPLHPPGPSLGPANGDSSMAVLHTPPSQMRSRVLHGSGTIADFMSATAAQGRMAMCTRQPRWLNQEAPSGIQHKFPDTSWTCCMRYRGSCVRCAEAQRPERSTASTHSMSSCWHCLPRVSL